MPLTLAALKTELTTDPSAFGYSGMADEAAAATLNLVRTGVPYAVFRGVFDAYEITAATDPLEWAAMNAQEKQRYAVIISAGKVDVSSANIRSAFTTMFGAGATRTALIALTTRPGSRAEVLFGLGTTITPSHIADAKRS